MNNKRIITAAVTGAGDTTEKSSHVPVTPKEIAEAAIESAKAGAAIAHIHVRDPQTGQLSHDLALFREVVERIREHETDVILNITAGGGGDFIPDPENPYQAGAGSDIQTPSERHEPVGALLPEICTLDCGSLNFGDQIYLGPANWLREHAKLIQESGVKPELEVFDTGQIRLANQLISEGLIDGNPMYQFCLGIPWGAAADAETIAYMQNRIVEGSSWSAFGIGRLQLPIVAEAAKLGGNVRVGLEDNLYLEKGVLGTNAQLVDKAVDVLKEINLEPMTPQEAREALNLKRFNQ
ncbi:3-keto-5-aminohexanoate cleavage protein [Alkalicoccobacillus porphyridii]|uniref:3-keto-5-aminohexanoate cleavage protein n=1 Tax=Alkalicoccobacillus porphyridii TaxID=2597270 RepID=A0A554A196_9BACI|nr:3-keto-5-aminohexanoate cleavage protein [Alkalicoccobacillus porphyridii]TSB47472.1 3-keto-5-aminohexanoate cleavage protein [Alkalicoccobacillus porphyridii]